MFGKLKEKLKGWIGKSKEKIEKSTEKTEKVKEKPEKKDKKAEKEGEVEKKDKAEILSEKPAKEVAEVLEQEPEETPQEITEKIKHIKEQEIDKKIKEKEEKIEQEIQQKEQEIQGRKKSLISKLKSKFAYKIDKEKFNEMFEDLEMLLLENNVALGVVEDIKSKLSEKLIGKEIKQENLETEIKQELKNTLNEILIEPDNPLDIIKQSAKFHHSPFVILFFGINGTGKTTTIAKLTNLLQKNNLSIVLAAADTFRAASIEQIQIHADNLKVPLIKHDYNSDPSAVGFDAIKYAKAHKKDVVIIDTAGRMHTKTNLLAEMEKICRVTKPDLKIFVAESIAGNDATEQAKSFHKMIGIDGSILSKADIDEKGGTIISVSHATNKPIFYLGTGQEYKDIQLFDKQKFISDLGL